MFVDHVHRFTTQADADATYPTPLDVAGRPMTLVSVSSYLSAVAGSPTGITIDLNITDGTASQVPVLAQSIGTAAGQVVIEPSTADAANVVAQDTDDNWRYNIDFNFTAGSTPTVTGAIVVRWQI